MQIESKTFEFKNTGEFSVERIENLLAEQNIVPLRWAIVEIKDSTFLVNTAYETKTC